MRRCRRLIASSGIFALITGSLLFVAAPSAVACSCGLGSVTKSVGRSDTVYIAKPRAFDLFPGGSFRVLRVLKGPARSNVRVKVNSAVPWIGGSGSCGTSLRRVEHVIVYDEGVPIRLSSCTQFLSGEEAVREAVSVLGPGRTVPRRPDPLWLAQWLIVAALVAGFVLLIRPRRHQKWRPLPPL